MKRSILFLLPVLFLISCDTKDRTPIPGKREDFLNLATSQNADNLLASQTIHVGNIESNTKWEQPGGKASHNLHSLKLPKSLQKIKSISIGSGSYDERRIMSNIVMSETHFYTLDTQGNVTSFNKKTGEQAWSISTLLGDDPIDEMLGGGVSISESAIIATTSFGRVFALNPKNGATLWRTDLGAPIRSAATIHNGRAFVVSINNTCYALDLETGKVSGKILWEHQGINEVAALLGSASPAASGDTVIATYSSGEIFALQADNGQVLWNDVLVSGARTDTLSAFPHIRARAIIDRGQVLSISYGGRMVAFDLKTGQRQWQVPISGLRSPAVLPDFVFVLTHDNQVLAIDRINGLVKWKAQLPSVHDGNTITYAGPTLANQELVLTESNGHVIFLDIQTGKETKRINVGAPTYLSPVICNEQLYILSDDGYVHIFGAK